MSVYYYLDPERVSGQNEQTGFYTSLYLEEMLSRLGIAAVRSDPELLRTRLPGAHDILLIGNESLTGKAREPIDDAAGNGCLVIGFGTLGLDDLFGVRDAGCIGQEDPFDRTAFFNAGSDILPAFEAGPELPVLSPVRTVEADPETVHGTLSADGRTCPGLIRTGSAVYFPFDLPDTLIKIVQGHPVPEGPSHYFPVGRVPDSRGLPVDTPSELPVADLFLLILEKLFYERGIPSLHTLPVCGDGSPADLLFYFGGDDDATSGELDETASRIMAERGLPYHINLMPTTKEGGFALSKEGYDRIRARGHELALHYDLTGGLSLFTKDGFDNQIDSFVNAYGTLPVCNVGHCLTQTGYAEYARYQSARGILGDNSRCGYLDPVDINAFNLFNYSFGTAFPHFVYDDAGHGGRRLPFCGLPITYYEPRLGGTYGDSDAKLNRCVRLAAYYGQTINLFSHPHYIAGYGGYDSSMTLRAFDRILEICREQGLSVRLTGVDELCLWWHARSRVSLWQGTAPGEWTVRLEDNDPVVIRIPEPKEGLTLLLDGEVVPGTARTVSGLPYRLLPVRGKGEHVLTIGRT